MTSYRPERLADRGIVPAAYHRKALAAQELAGLVRPRGAGPSLEVRVRHRRQRLGRELRRLTRRRVYAFGRGRLEQARAALRSYVRDVAAWRAHDAAVRLCAERGHVTYRPDPSCPADCTRCVRCDLERHVRGGGLFA